MSTINLLYKREYAVTDKIKVVIPKVKDVLENEDLYYGQISTLTSMPIDYMVELDDIGIDFTEINDYQLFLLFFTGLQRDDTSLIFGDLDFKKFDFDKDEMILYNPIDDIRIDRVVYAQISATLCKMHHIEKNRKRPVNTEVKEYLLERARTKRKRRKNRLDMSQLESLIISLVNTPEFKYDYDGVLDLSIYQFNESVRQIVKKVDYNNRMYGIYAGTVDPKAISRDELTWLKQ